MIDGDGEDVGMFRSWIEKLNEGIKRQKVRINEEIIGNEVTF
jgi:hypothetical protein